MNYAKRQTKRVHKSSHEKSIIAQQLNMINLTYKICVLGVLFLFIIISTLIRLEFIF